MNTRQRRRNDHMPPPRYHTNQGQYRSEKRSTSRQKEKRGQRQQLLVLLAALVSLGTWYLTPISSLVVDILLTQVPLEADIELGREALLQMERSNQAATIHDSRWTPQIQSIGWDLVASTPQAQDHNWDFGVLDDRQAVNAFALPGGVIRVTKALLDELHLTRGEMAALIGHEMGHVLHRHSQARLLERQLLATVLKALVYEDDDPHQENFGEAIGELLLKSADWLGQQSFSRSNEYEADATSWELLSHSQSYNPQDLQSLLNKLWEYHGRQGGQTSWESTHPGTLDRIGALDEKWNALSRKEQLVYQRRNSH